MAPSLTDGVPGLEAIHTLTPPSPWPEFALNDWMDPTTGLTRQWANQAAWSQLEKVTGLHDRPDSDDPRVSLVYQVGELPLPRIARGRSITYSGMIAGQTLSDMRAQIAALRAAATSALTSPTAWLINVAYDATYDDSSLVFAAYGIPTGFTCDDEQGQPTLLPSPFQRAFDFTFRQSDGRWWVTPDSFLCTVGTADSPIDDGTAGTLTMTGTAPSEPVFSVYGSGSGEATIAAHNTTLGVKVTVNQPAAMSSGDLLVIDFGQRSVTYTPNGGGATDYTGYVDWANSDWWWEPASAAPLLIGDQSVKVDGDPWSVSAMPACW
jgi:hypothetical protein